MTPLLSVLIPVYNESNTVATVLARVLAAPLDGGLRRQIILVNDCSTDDTQAVIDDFMRAHPGQPISCYRHTVNRGKGAALRTAIAHATGDYVVVQDADLEYDPGELNRLLGPVRDGRADVVYGSRFSGAGRRRAARFWHTLGNRLLTGLSNLLNGLDLSDVETGYKLFRGDLIRGLELREARFGFDPEVTARLARMDGVRIHEVEVSYRGRGYHEGKKINWKDGLRALWCMFRYRFFS